MRSTTPIYLKHQGGKPRHTNLGDTITMAETMSRLEEVLRNRNGINIVLRQKLIKAYNSENGKTEVPRLIEENTRLIKADLLPLLRLLAANEE